MRRLLAFGMALALFSGAVGCTCCTRGVCDCDDTSWGCPNPAGCCSATPPAVATYHGPAVPVAAQDHGTHE
jgi:hypothetical protein